MPEDTVNGGATNPPTDTKRAQLGSLDVHGVWSQLDTLRAKHGADTPIGHRCSNLIEQLKNYQTAPPDLRRDLDRFIMVSIADLARLTKEAT